MKKILINLLFAPLFIQAQSDADLTRETNSRNTIEGHIYFLASDELKGRDTGSQEIDIAAQYLASTLRRYGVKPVPEADDGYFQNVPLELSEPATKKVISMGDFRSEELVIFSGVNMEVEMEVVFVGYGNKDDYKPKDAEGKLLIALAGLPDYQSATASYTATKVKKALAIERGAKGLVEICAFEKNAWSRFSGYFNRASTQIVQENSADFLHAWVLDESALLEKSVSKKRAKASVTIEGISKLPLPSKNVVGMVEGTDPALKDEFIIYSAHYDHIGIGKANAEGDSIYNGTRDNAIGSVTVLSAAENIAKYPTQRSALFIFFTAEEKGLLGSEYYADHPLIPLEQVVYCFNSDNGGYNDTSIATIIGLGRTTAEKHIKAACEEFDLEAIDDPAPEQGLFDRSDNVKFAAKGVPAPTFSLGFRAFDAEIGKYYHQASDNPDNVDYEYLTKFFGAYVLSCRLIANDPTTPFWVEGDKYYKVGEELYER